MPPADSIQRVPNQTWKNYGQNLGLTVGTFYLVSNGAGGSPADGLAALRSIVVEVEGKGGSLAPVGSAWSFSPVAANPVAMVDLTRMAMQMPFTAGQLQPDVDPLSIIHVQAGTTIEQVLRYVEGSGRELLAMGGNCGQTVAGVISTGSHGGMLAVPGFPDATRALYLVTEHGVPCWLERASRPLISDAFATQLEQAGVTIVREDSVFNDAVIGLGAFGILNSVVLDTAPSYYVACSRQQRDFDDNLRAAFFEHDFRAMGLNAAPDHFEVVVNPHRCSPDAGGVWRGAGAAFVTIMNKIPNDGRPTTEDTPGATLNDGDLGTLVAGWLTLAPEAIPLIVDNLVPTFYPSRSVHGPLSWVNPLSTQRVATLSLEIGCSSTTAAQTFDRILEGLTTLGVRLPGLIGIRQTPQSAATLSVARWPLTYTFEFACLGVGGLQDKLVQLLDFLEQAGVDFSFNLGQIVGRADGTPWLNRERLDRIYGTSNLQRWRTSRARFCPGGNVFRNQLTDSLGLT